MIFDVVTLIIIVCLVGIILMQVYSIKTLSDSVEAYAYTCNRLAHENAELRKIAQENIIRFAKDQIVTVAKENVRLAGENMDLRAFAPKDYK